MCRNNEVFLRFLLAVRSGEVWPRYDHKHTHLPRKHAQLSSFRIAAFSQIFQQLVFPLAASSWSTFAAQFAQDVSSLKVNLWKMAWCIRGHTWNQELPGPEPFYPRLQVLPQIIVHQLLVLNSTCPRFFPLLRWPTRRSPRVTLLVNMESYLKAILSTKKKNQRLGGPPSQLCPNYRGESSSRYPNVKRLPRYYSHNSSAEYTR